MDVKRCSKCGIEKPLIQYHTHVATRDRLRPECMDCEHEARRARYLVRKYGISQEEYDARFLAPKGVCAICGQAQRASQLLKVVRKRAPRRNMDILKVDHDHMTGAVRGLLCEKCNAGLGAFEDDIARLAAAISYLQRYATSATSAVVSQSGDVG